MENGTLSGPGRLIIIEGLLGRNGELIVILYYYGVFNSMYHIFQLILLIIWPFSQYFLVIKGQTVAIFDCQKNENSKNSGTFVMVILDFVEFLDFVLKILCKLFSIIPNNSQLFSKSSSFTQNYLKIN